MQDFNPTHDAASRDDGALPPRTLDRREAAPECDPVALRSGLTRAQIETIDAMESFRWRLAFVRWPVFQAAIPVLFNRDGTRHVVIREDGSIDEHPTLTLRE